ncbi:LOW QUALITY PROTEIN: glycerol kinase 5-like [Saccoglossus kowalevskii]
MTSENDNRAIVAVDVGTTTVRCHVYDSRARLISESFQQLKILQPSPGCKEICPDSLWSQFTEVIKDAISASKTSTLEEIVAMGISTHRGTYTLWDRKTGKVLHNFITWQDTRAAEFVDSVNKSISYGVVKGGAKFLHFFTRMTRWRAASSFIFSTQHAILRLAWYFDQHPEVKCRAEAGEIMFGTIDTWLVWKLTGGKKHVTDYSNGCSTGMFDPYVMSWNWIYFTLLGLPMTILPKLQDTCGRTDLEVADQQSAMFGECCFERGDVKCTMGTGTFMDINVGRHPTASKTGLYSLVCWKIKDEIVFMCEGNSADTGTSVDWGQKIGLYDNIGDTSKLANSVDNSNGTCFVPGFSGIQAPVNDDSACCAFMGLKPTTKKEHMIRAMLESFAFRFKQLYDTAMAELKHPMSSYIKIDGGVANNDFVVQLVADLTNKPVDKAKNLDTTCLGAAFLAGLQTGIWKDKEELKNLRESMRVFQPRNNQDQYHKIYKIWEKSVQRCRKWNTE